jgi:transposase
MMTQEEYVNEVLAAICQGKTVKEAADQIGCHPATVSEWLKAGGRHGCAHRRGPSRPRWPQHRAMRFLADRTA